MNLEKCIEKGHKKMYTKSRKVDPKKDFYFKKIFGKEGNEDILKDFLEAILNIEIESLKLGQETIMAPERFEEKDGILDIRTTLSDGTKINLEMQLDRFGDIGKRAIFYMSKLYVKSIKKGTFYDDFPKTIVIFITNFNYYKDIEKYHTKWMLTEVDNTTHRLDNVEIHVIELEKFKEIKGKSMQIENKLEEWLAYLLYERKEMREMAIKRNPKIQKAEKELEKLTKEQEEYLEELREKGRMDRLSIAYAAERDGREAGMKKGLEEGIAKGIEEGRAEGRAEGHAEGRAEGMAQGKVEGRLQGKKESQHEIAKRLLELGLDIDIIEKSTGLSNEEIIKIKEEAEK